MSKNIVKKFGKIYQNPLYLQNWLSGRPLTDYCLENRKQYIYRIENRNYLQTYTEYLGHVQCGSFTK